ncbi:hypothetical protein ACFCZ3_19705 [Cellulosimicrobium cellulans]|uniref:hypothetical protein n=1 Tax=Cellulosimicrobium cellulans TaxID=1710 RepID=UPI0035E2F632
MNSGPIDRTWNVHDRERYVRTGLVGPHEQAYYSDPEVRRVVDALIGVALTVADVAVRDPREAKRVLGTLRFVDEDSARATIDLPPAPLPRAVSDTEPNIDTLGF